VPTILLPGQYPQKKLLHFPAGRQGLTSSFYQVPYGRCFYIFGLFSKVNVHKNIDFVGKNTEIPFNFGCRLPE
jgi:hypothetical protein